MKRKLNGCIYGALLTVPWGSWATMVVCPVQPHNALVSIQVYDGNPYDKVDLVPEPANQNNGHWKYLERIYEQKRPITVRCQYHDDLRLDVTVQRKITVCRSSNKHGALSFLCDRAFMPAEDFVQQGYQANDPTMESGMINDNPSLGHHLFQVAYA